MTPANTDPRTQVNQGVAGTGAAVVFQDRFDPAAGMMQYALKKQAERDKRKLKAQEQKKKLQEKLEGLDVVPADEVDREELIAMRETFMDTMTTIMKTEGPESILDPTSGAGRVFYRMQKALDTASTESAQNLEMYEAQKKEVTDNPEAYNLDAVDRRIDAFNNAQTIKERTAILKGEKDIGDDEDPYAQGLLVPNIDKWAPLDNVVRTVHESVKERGDWTTKTKSAKRAQIREQIVLEMQNEKYALQLRRYGQDVDAYIEEMVDKAVAEVDTMYSETEDEERTGFRMNFESGIGQNESFQFAYDERPVESVFNEGDFKEGVFGDNKDLSTISISHKDGKPKLFDFEVTDNEGEVIGMNLKGTQVIRDSNGKMYLTGTLDQDVENSDAMSEITGGIFSGQAKRGELVRIPLDERGNPGRFAAQFGVTLDQLDQVMDKMREARRKGKEEANESAANEGYEEDLAVAFDPEAENYTDESKMETRMNYLESQGVKATRDGTTIIAGGQKYDLSSEFQRKVFKKRFGPK